MQLDICVVLGILSEENHSSWLYKHDIETINEKYETSVTRLVSRNGLNHNLLMEFHPHNVEMFEDSKLHFCIQQFYLAVQQYNAESLLVCHLAVLSSQRTH